MDLPASAPRWTDSTTMARDSTIVILPTSPNRIPIIPNPYNPLDWNRYSYVRYSPVNNVDPSGHFTDEALKKYLQDTYGDEWEDIWKSWLKDKAWMKTLHGAQAGDILSRVWHDSNGNAQISHYMINGVSDQELSGLGASSPDLNTVYNTSSGIGVIRPDSEAGFIEIGHVGNISYDIHKVSSFEHMANYGVYYGGLALLGSVQPFSVPCSILGFVFGGYQTFVPNAAMGFNAGDIYLRVNTFYATGVDGVMMEGIRTQFTYISRGAYVQSVQTNTPIYNPHRYY